MAVPKPSKPSKPSKSTSQFNLFGIIGIAIGLIAAGSYVKPFITKPSAVVGPNVVNTSVPMTHESIMARYENGCPPHQFKSVVQVSRTPNIILIDGFVTPEEIEVLLRIAYLPPLPPTPLYLVRWLIFVSRNPLFEASTIVNYDNTP